MPPKSYPSRIIDEINMVLDATGLGIPHIGSLYELQQLAGSGGEYGGFYSSLYDQYAGTATPHYKVDQELGPIPSDIVRQFIDEGYINPLAERGPGGQWRQRAESPSDEYVYRESSQLIDPNGQAGWYRRGDPLLQENAPGPTAPTSPAAPVSPMDMMYGQLQGAPQYIDQGVTRPSPQAMTAAQARLQAAKDARAAQGTTPAPQAAPPQDVRHTFGGMYDDDVAPAPTTATAGGGTQPGVSVGVDAAAGQDAVAPTSSTTSGSYTEISATGDRWSGEFWTNDAKRKVEAQWERLYPQLQEIIFGQMNTSSRARANPQDEMAAARNRIFGTDQGGGFIKDLEQTLSSGGDATRMQASLTDQAENLRRLKRDPPPREHAKYQKQGERGAWYPAYYKNRMDDWEQEISRMEMDLRDMQNASNVYRQTSRQQLSAMMKSAETLIKGVPEYFSSGFDEDYRNLIESDSRLIMDNANPYVDKRGRSLTQPSVTHTFGGMYDGDEDTVEGETFTPGDVPGAPPPITVQPGAGIPTDAEGDMNWESDPVATDMPVEGDMNWGDYTDPDAGIPTDGVDTTGTGADTTGTGQGGGQQGQTPPAGVTGASLTLADLSIKGRAEFEEWHLTNQQHAEQYGLDIPTYEESFQDWKNGVLKNQVVAQTGLAGLAAYVKYPTNFQDEFGLKPPDALTLPQGIDAQSVLDTMQGEAPEWWPPNIIWPPVTTRSVGGGGNTPPSISAQFDAETFENVRESVRRGDWGSELAEQLRVADPMAVGEPFAQDVNNDGIDELFIRDPDGNIRQIRKEEQTRETIDQQIASALAANDVTRAQQLRQFNTQPTDMERFQAALDFSNRPANSFELANIAAGNYPLSSIGPDGQRSAMPGQPVNQSFDDMFGGYGGDTDALMSRMMNPNDPNAVAPSLVGRTREALGAAHGWELPETPEQFQTSFSTLIQSGFNPATAARALGFMPDEVQSFNQSITPGFQRIGEGDQNLREAFNRAFGQPDFTSLMTPGKTPILEALQRTGSESPSQWWQQGQQDYRTQANATRQDQMNQGESTIKAGSISGPSTEPNFMNTSMPSTFTGGQQGPMDVPPTGTSMPQTSDQWQDRFNAAGVGGPTSAGTMPGMFEPEERFDEDDLNLTREERLARERQRRGVQSGDFMQNFANPTGAETVNNWLFGRDAAQLMRGGAVDKPIGNVMSAAGSRPISTQGWTNLTESGQQQIRAFAKAQGISDNEFQNALKQQNPGSQTFSNTVKKTPGKRRQQYA